MSRMVRESLALGERCRCVPSPSLLNLTLKILPRRWYTSMLGKQSSLTALVSLLRAHSVRIGESPLGFVSGHMAWLKIK